MTDTENSDDERYANESFENESDTTDIHETSEFESESTQNSDDDINDEDLPSVKINTGPIKSNSYANNFSNINKTDVVPYASSSDEEDDVIVGQTLAEINTPSMLFEDELAVPSTPHLQPLWNENYPGEAQKSSAEVSEEEEDDEDEELERIKHMEEKYLQQISAKTPNKPNIEYSEHSQNEKEQQESIKEISETETESESENRDENEAASEVEVEEVQEQESEFDDENALPSKKEEYPEDFPPNKEDLSSDEINKLNSISETQINLQENNTKSIEQQKLIELIQSSLAHLNIDVSNDNEDNLLKMCLAPLLSTQSDNMPNVTCPKKIALAIANALENAGIATFEVKTKLVALEQNQQLIKKFNENDDDANKPEDDEKIEVEDLQNNDFYGDDPNTIYYDGHLNYCITSKTPTSFNSDNYVFHANFIRSFHHTNSTDKLRVKPHPRKSMSFSNERLREIERHNHILLRKILTQKPTYALKGKSSQSSLQKLPSETNTRLTTSAVNRKKQRRQIELDNLVLKRKLEAIALRKRPFI